MSKARVKIELRQCSLLMPIWFGLLISHGGEAAESLNRASSAPQFDYTSKPAFYMSWAQFGAYYNETKLLRTLNSVSNLNLTLYHQPFAIILDGGWAAPTRDAQGKLYFDPLKFPSGTNVLKLIHDYGCKAMLWLEANGPDITESSNTPSTSGTNVEYDAKTIAEWGFDGAKFDLITDAETGTQKIAQVIRFVTAFRAVATNRPTYFYHDVGVDMERDQFRDFPPGCVICENSENDPDDILYWTRTMMTHLWNVNGRNQWTCGREVYEAWAPPHPKPYNTSFLNVWSMLGSPYVFTAVTDAEHYPQYRDIYSRRECIALNNDPLYAPPVALFHTTTNLGLTRRRSDGTLAVLAFNTTTNQTQSLTLQFSQLGLPEGHAADVRDIYYETNYGRFSDSFSFDLEPMQTKLLNFDSEGRQPILEITKSPAQDCSVTVLGRPNQNIVLQGSTDLRSWFPLATNTLGLNPWVYQDDPARGGASQYYFRGVRP